MASSPHLLWRKWAIIIRRRSKEDWLSILTFGWYGHSGWPSRGQQLRTQGWNSLQDVQRQIAEEKNSSSNKQTDSCA
jgi:hypothetical protein